MSGILSKIIFSKSIIINSKHLFYNNNKPICDFKINNVITINRFLRNIRQNVNIIKDNNINQLKLRRNYVRLYNRENQTTNNGNKINQSPSTTTTSSSSSSLPQPTSSSTTTININSSINEPRLGIFKRFKDAYNKHGKVLLACHVVTCLGWIIGLYILAESGFDIKNLFKVLEKLHIMTNETSDGIIKKIETFDLEKFLRNYHFDYILNDSKLEWIGKSITGITLKHMIVAVMLYKIFTPLRYLTTLTVAKFVIDALKRKGVIQAPPKGSSIKELAQEQQQVVRRYITRKNDYIRKGKKLLRKQSIQTPISSSTPTSNSTITNPQSKNPIKKI